MQKTKRKYLSFMLLGILSFLFALILSLITTHENMRIVIGGLVGLGVGFLAPSLYVLSSRKALKQTTILATDEREQGVKREATLLAFNVLIVGVLAVALWQFLFGDGDVGLVLSLVMLFSLLIEFLARLWLRKRGA